MHTKSLHVTVEKSADPAFDARFVMSAATPDRVGDTIAPDAYKKAAETHNKLIALWQHDADRPIGYWSNLKAQGDKLVGDLKLSATNLGLMIKQLLADGVPLAASIGFRGEADVRRDAKGNPIGLHFKTLDLLETSVVSVPAHPRAQQIAKSFGIELKPENADPSSAGSSAELRDQVAKRAAAALHTSLNAIHKDSDHEAL